MKHTEQATCIISNSSLHEIWKKGNAKSIIYSWFICNNKYIFMLIYLEREDTDWLNLLKYFHAKYTCVLHWKIPSF